MTDARAQVRVTDVHTAHCCYKHGCKFDWHQLGECTVVKGPMWWQSFRCVICDNDISEIWEMAHLENELHTARAQIAQLEREKEDQYWDGYHEGRSEM